MTTQMIFFSFTLAFLLTIYAHFFFFFFSFVFCLVFFFFFSFFFLNGYYAGGFCFVFLTNLANVYTSQKNVENTSVKH